MGASTAFHGLRHPAKVPEQAPCGFCQQVIQLTYAQQRWLRWHPGQKVFCTRQCCNKHYQDMRRQKPNGRQEEYQRYIRQRQEADVLRERHKPGVIHAEDQDWLGGGWSWFPLPSYGAYRCACTAGQECEACQTWKAERKTADVSASHEKEQTYDRSAY